MTTISNILDQDGKVATTVTAVEPEQKRKKAPKQFLFVGTISGKHRKTLKAEHIWLQNSLQTYCSAFGWCWWCWRTMQMLPLRDMVLRRFTELLHFLHDLHVCDQLARSDPKVCEWRENMQQPTSSVMDLSFTWCISGRSLPSTYPLEYEAGAVMTFAFRDVLRHLGTLLYMYMIVIYTLRNTCIHIIM